MSVINTHKYYQWLPFHSISCALLVNISLITEVHLYDLKVYDRDYRYVTDSIFRHSRFYPTYYHVLNLVGLTDSDCICMSYDGESDDTKGGRHDSVGSDPGFMLVMFETTLTESLYVVFNNAVILPH